MAFKLAHLSDLHIGYRSTRLTGANGVNIREIDGYKALHTMVGQILKEKVDAVLISGDTFHSPMPEMRAIFTVQTYLRKLADAGIKVYILAGNHDQNDVRADIASSRLLHDEMRGIYSYTEPYKYHEIADGIHLHMVSHHMYAEQAATMAQVKPVADEVNIFATHGSCINPTSGEKMHTPQSPREIIIPDFLLEDRSWSYSLLGHIHERGYVGSRDGGPTDSAKKKIFYNGSLIRRGFSDKECKLGRGWTLWTIENDGSFTPTFKRIAQRPQEEFKLINAKDLTSREISDRIISSLKSTQVKGLGVFDGATAPLLQQKIKGLSPGKRAGLDWAAINENSKHALYWDIKQVSEAVEEEDADTDVPLDLQTSETTDVVKLFDDWVEDAESLKDTDEDLKKRVTDQTRAFVELGQEEILND